jgi:phosphate-selective porin OprO and OprP
MRIRSPASAAFLGLLLSSVASAAMAQPTTEQRIAELEALVKDLASQIADLKTQTGAAVQDVRNQASANATSLANARPTISTADGTQKFAVRGLVQFDAAAYDEDESVPGANDLSSGTNFRRARLGIEGTFAKDWNYNLTGEFGGSGGEAAQLNQAYVEYAGWKPFDLTNPVRLRLGAWATPTGLEDATSNAESLFLERAAVSELVRNFAGGDGRTGVGILANGDHWYADAVLTGAVVGTPAAPEFDEQYGYLTRVAFNPFYSPDYAVHIGANVQGVLSPADTAAGLATTQVLRLRERPEIRVDGTRLVDTGNITADSLTSYGLELGATYKRFHVAGEAFQIDVDRIGSFDPSFSGWYAQAAWTLTGESHLWNAANGGFRGIKPAANFDPAAGKWGAFEVALRYSVLDLNDGQGLAGAATPAGGVRGGEQKITTLGLNWYPNAVFRFLLDYQDIDIDRLNGVGLQVGEQIKVISLRSQVAF